MSLIVRYALVAVISVGAFSYVKSKWQDWRDYKNTVTELQLAIDTKDLLLEQQREAIVVAETAEKKFREKVQLEINQADRRERKLAKMESENAYQKELIADCLIDPRSLRISTKD